MQEIINDTPIIYLCIAGFIITIIALAIFHFGYAEPKRKKQENRPIINTKNWNLNDYDFNSN